MLPQVSEEEYLDRLMEYEHSKVRWELRAYNAETGETLVKSDDYDQDVVLSDALHLYEKVDIMLNEEVQGDLRDRATDAMQDLYHD